MMKHEILVPRTADGAKEVTIVEWLKEIGAEVQKGEDLVEATTEKITLYISAPADGTLSEIAAPAGSKVRVGDVIGYITSGG